MRLFKHTVPALVVGSAILFLISGWAGYSWRLTKLHEQSLPAALETVGFVRAGSDWELAHMLMPIRWEGCGAAVFNLSESTQKKIDEEGIGFFLHVRQGRGAGAVRYGPWQETPVPLDWLGDGSMAASLHCADFLPFGLAGNAGSTVSRSGGYYTTSRTSQLVVIPDLKLVVLAF
jgi:hypothetical protein